MNLIPNWRRVAKRAWSVWLTVLAAGLGAIEFAIPVFMDNPPIERGRFAALAALVSFLAAIARVISQPSLHEDEK